MGWIRRIFGSTDTEEAESARIPTTESVEETNLQPEDPLWNLPEERTEAGDAYFESMSEMQAAITKRQYEKAARLARENLRTIPKWIEEETYNASIRPAINAALDRFLGSEGEAEPKPANQEGSLLPPSIPVFQQGGTILALVGDEEGLSLMADLAKGTPELGKWIGHVEKHWYNLELFGSILEAVHSHPNCLQKDVKALIGEKDGHRVATLISYLEKAKKVVRVKEGRTYRILPAATKGVPTRTSRKPSVTHRPSPTVMSDAGAGDSSFVAIDFETATADRDSACALGLVVFEQGRPTIQHRFLIRPPGNEYDPFNTWIHGIGPRDTERSPKFPAVWTQAAGIIGDRLVVAHNTAFDMSVARRTAERYSYDLKPLQFACTYRLARSVDPQRGSWNLADLAREFDIDLDHHDPVSDAQAAGRLWLALAGRAGMPHTHLLEQHGYRLGLLDLSAYKPFSNAVKSSGSLSPKDFSPQCEPDPKNALFGKKIVFTGTLASMPRREAFQHTVDAGARPVTSVSRKTDCLVVGEQDLSKVGETGLSSKHRKALELNSHGSQINIIDEDLFFCLAINTSQSNQPKAP